MKTDGWITIGTKMENKSFEKQIKQLEKELESYEKSYEKALNPPESFKKSESALNSLQLKIEKTRNKLIQLKNQQDKLNDKGNHLGDSMDNLGDKITSNIAKIGKMALAVFGVRGAIATVNSALGIISQYDSQLSANIEYIKYSLAMTLYPIIQKITNLVYTLLNYVNYLAKAWFNVNLFSNSSAKVFNKAKSTTAGMAKDAEKMNKSLANGIDEVTNLEDNSATMKADTSEGLTNLGDFDNVEIPGWIEWLADNGDLVKNIVIGIVGAFLMFKTLGIIDNMFELGESIGKVSEKVTELFSKEGSTKKLIGIALIMAGIITVIDSFLKYLNDPSWENFGGIIAGIGLAIVGIGLLIGSLPVVVAGVIALIVGLIVKNWEKIQSFFLDIAKWCEENLGIFGEILGDTIRDSLKIFDGFFTGVKQILDGIIQICKGDFAGGLETIFKGIGNVIISIVNSIIYGINTLLTPVRGLIVEAGKILGKDWTMSSVKIPLIPKLARGGIVNNPGRGVNMGSYVAGERGAEAILPLQNSKFINDFAGEIAEYQNNDTIIQLLIELNRNILELANRPNIVEIDGKKVVKATYKEHVIEGERQNNNPSVRRT